MQSACREREREMVDVVWVTGNWSHVRIGRVDRVKERGGCGFEWVHR